MMNNRTVKLTSLSPLEASLDRAKLVEEFKIRGNRETNTESRVTNTRVSTFVTKSEIKKTCVSTNRIHSTLPRVNVSLLQVNEGCFPKKIPKEKPIMQLDSRKNHLKEGGNDINQARSKLRKWKSKALNPDYNKFQVKKSSSKHYTITTSQRIKSRKLGDEFGKSFAHEKREEDRPCMKAGSRPPALWLP